MLLTPLRLLLMTREGQLPLWEGSTRKSWQSQCIWSVAAPAAGGDFGLAKEAIRKVEEGNFLSQSSELLPASSGGVPEQQKSKALFKVYR